MSFTNKWVGCVCSEAVPVLSVFLLIASEMWGFARTISKADIDPGCWYYENLTIAHFPQSVWRLPFLLLYKLSASQGLRVSSAIDCAASKS